VSLPVRLRISPRKPFWREELSCKRTLNEYKQENPVTVESLNIFFDRMDIPGGYARIPQKHWHNVDEIGVF
jgi:hypothetical protein